jgi:hypothetical protein
MTYAKTAHTYARGNVLAMKTRRHQSEIRPEFGEPLFAADVGALDAHVLVPAGSCFYTDFCDRPVQSGVMRDYFDAYDATDRTAIHTDCASVQK